MTNSANEPRHPGHGTAINDDSQLADSIESSADQSEVGIDQHDENDSDGDDNEKESSPSPMPPPQEPPD